MQKPTVSAFASAVKGKFLVLAARWYDKRYSKIYDNYYSKGKSFPLYLPTRQYILSEYFANDASWLEYKSFSQLVRNYRNVIVHDQLIGVVEHLGLPLVPKKEHINDYRTFTSIQSAASNIETLYSAFILKQEQMIANFATIQKLFNTLWNKAIEDLHALFYTELNPTLLARFNLTIIS